MFVKPKSLAIFRRGQVLVPSTSFLDDAFIEETLFPPFLFFLVPISLALGVFLCVHGLVPSVALISA